MACIVVVGLQWGDEAKGKIVDWLSVDADAVVRFQGGSNAGHTIVVEGKVYKLSLLPSSILRENKKSIISGGVVLDPYLLLKEIENIRKDGIDVDPQRLHISETCPLVLDVHRETELILEEVRGSKVIGTTNMGIGPCYEDKVGRRSIRLCDLLHVESLREKVECLLSYHNLLRKASNRNELSVQEVLDKLLSVSDKILPFIKNVGEVIHDMCMQDKTILFEGAQGALLDVDHGTYPYVTSSNTLGTFAQVSCGVGALGTMRIIGLAKAYTTRVGNGPFVTEEVGEVGEILVSRGREFGTVSNRKRRCGWFDAVLVRHAVRLSGVSEVALTKLDVLDTMHEIKVCVGYKHGTKHYNYLPAAHHIQEELEPIYETFPGWCSNTLGAVSASELPTNALRYIREIEKFIGTKINLISTGPDRNHVLSLLN